MKRKDFIASIASFSGASLLPNQLGSVLKGLGEKEVDEKPDDYEEFADRQEEKIKWRSDTTGKPIPITIRRPDQFIIEDGGALAVLIIANHGYSRVSIETDDNTVNKFLQEGFIVVYADYENDMRAVAPEINSELTDLHRFIHNKLSNSYQRLNRIYVMPAGYAIERNVSYYEWNGFHYGLDVMYPINVNRPVPAIVHSHWAAPLESKNRRNDYANFNAYYDSQLHGLMLKGYAYVVVDHPWNEQWMRSDMGNEERLKQPTSHPKAVEQATASVRWTRSNSFKYNIDSDCIGFFGFSKGSGQAAYVAHLASRPVSESEPFPNVSNTVAVSCVHSGMFSTIDLIDSRTSPMYLSVGTGELKRQRGDVKPDLLRAFASRLKEHNVDHVAHIEPGLSHKIVDRIEALKEMYGFIDKFLQPSTLT